MNWNQFDIVLKRVVLILLAILGTYGVIAFGMLLYSLAFPPTPILY
jgi:hypothetical protein